MNYQKAIKEFAVITVGTVIVAAAVFFFMLPSHVSVGSGAALAMVLSVLGTYFGGMVVDNFIFGINIKRRVCVISEKLDQIVDYVLHDLHSGATLNEIIGAFDNTPRKEMIAIVDRNEYKRLMDYIRKVDPKAFVTVYSVSDMRYQPKK